MIRISVSFEFNVHDDTSLRSLRALLRGPVREVVRQEIALDDDVQLTTIKLPRVRQRKRLHK